MRRFVAIIESPTPPPTNSIWIDKGVLKYFYNGEWCEFINTEKAELSGLYDKYVQMGGTKTPEQFAKALKDLIDA